MRGCEAVEVALRALCLGETVGGISLPPVRPAFTETKLCKPHLPSRGRESLLVTVSASDADLGTRAAQMRLQRLDHGRR